MSHVVQIPHPDSPLFGQNVKQWISLRDGTSGQQSGTPDRFVTVNDLLDGGFISEIGRIVFTQTDLTLDEIAEEHYNAKELHNRNNKQAHALYSNHIKPLLGVAIF